MSDSSWRDWNPGRTGVSVAQLSDEESVVCQIVAEPYREETAESDDALHVPVVFMDTPGDFVDMSDDPVVTGEEDGETSEYNIINSSSGFFEALIQAFPSGSNMEGQVMEITAYQPTEDSFSRYYNIEAV